MPEIQAPGTDPSRPIGEPARFHFAITWLALYVSVPGSQKSVVRPSTAGPHAVTKPASQPDFTWAMVVPKMYRPLPRRRRVSEIAPAPASRLNREPRRFEPPGIAAARVEPPHTATPIEPSPAHVPPAVAQIQKHFSFHRTWAIGSAAAVLAALGVYLIPKASAPKRKQGDARPSAAAVLHFPSAPVAPQSVPERPIQKRAPESRKLSPTITADARPAPKAEPAPVALEPAVPSVKRARVRLAPPETVYFVPAPPEMEDFQSSRIVSKVKPVYPEIARLAKVQGTVRFKAIIGADGAVQNLDLESGPTMLAQAAIEAIRQWTFLPATRNGNPVEDEIHIDVSFTLVQ